MTKKQKIDYYSWVTMFGSGLFFGLAICERGVMATISFLASVMSFIVSSILSWDLRENNAKTS